MTSANLSLENNKGTFTSIVLVIIDDLKIRIYFYLEKESVHDFIVARGAYHICLYL